MHKVVLNKKQEVFLRKNYHRLTYRQIGEELGLNNYLIGRKARELGIVNFRNDKLDNTKKEIHCRICRKTLPNTEEFFYFKKDKSRVSQAICKTCTKIRAKEKKSTLRGYFQSLLRSKKALVRLGDKKAIGFNLTLSFLLKLYDKQNGVCAITGLKLTTTNQNGGRCFTNISIDRRNNNLGYTKRNVQLVCSWANYAKETLTMKELIEFINATYKYQKKLKQCQKRTKQYGA